MLHSMLDLLSKDSLVMWLNYYGNLCLNVKYKIICHNGYEVIRKTCADAKVTERRLSTAKGQVLFKEYQESKKNRELYNEGKKLWRKRYSDEVPITDINIIKERSPYWSEKYYEELESTFEASGIKGFKTKLGMSLAQKIIISVLEQNDLPFKYQPSIAIGGVTCYSDFVIDVPWLFSCFPYEHFDVINDDKNEARCSVTVNRYIKAGMIPGIDLLITGEGKSRGFDADFCEKALANFINQMSAVIMSECRSGK